MINFAFGASTHVGNVRTENQDDLYTADPVFVVADGMGGHHGGEIAAQIAASALGESGAVSTIDDLIRAVQDANDLIVERSKDEPELKGMGTTVVALVGLQRTGPSRLGVANVGDSRLYRLVDDGLHQHTEDHSLVEALVRDGRLSRGEAQVHPQRNIITRALGIDEKVLVDAWELVPAVGDRYVLCSDGLFSEIGNPEIADVLRSTPDPQVAAEDLVVRALAAGGGDNVTVVVVDIVHADSVDELPEDRVTDIRKALPEGILSRDLDVDEMGSTTEGTTVFDTDGAGGATAASTQMFTWRLAVFVVAVIMVLIVLMASVTAYARSGYFIGQQEQRVVVYQGRPGGVLWFDPTVEDVVDGLLVDDLDDTDRSDVIDGIEFDSLGEAEAYVEEILVRVGREDP